MSALQFDKHAIPLTWYGPAALDRVIMANSPIAYYKFDEASGLPQDSSGNGNHMTAVSGSPTYQQAGPGGAYAISYPSAAYHERAVFSTATTNISIEYWCYRVGNASSDMVRQGVTSGGVELEYTTTAGAFRPNLPGVGTLGSMGTIAASAWTHVVLTRGASLWAGYLNGIPSAPGSASPGTPTGNFRVIGAGATEHRYAFMAYYNVELTPAQAQARYFAMMGLLL